MDRQTALQIVKNQLTDKRYEHTVGVLETAERLAMNYSADMNEVQLAAIFHDYAKFRPKEEMKTIILEQKMDQELLRHHHELWHAPVGAYLVQTEVGIENEPVLQAIKCHTTGRENMNLLDKIVFLADYIEPGRSFPGVAEVRKLAEEDLDLAVLQALQNTILFLLEKKQPIYPDTIYTYNEFRRKLT